MTGKLTDVALSDRVYMALRGDIIAGHYQPGEKITISSLAKRFGVSPTPVREAIRLLLAQGGLDMKPNHSVTVAELSATEYREIADIRHELEGMAAAQAATRRSHKQLAKLIALNKSLETARLKGRFREVLVYNRQFHFAMTEMADMSIMASVLENLWLRSGPLLNVLYNYDYQRPLDDHPHDELIAAIADGDAKRAKKAIQRDIKLGTKIVVQHLEELEAKRSQRIGEGTG